ncbi:MAG: LD-carboxypeptidase [Clostridia bacterium]|nr:LD-carboxypeptidase [Clostridia bacterium]
MSTTQLTIPSPLQPGDKVALIAPCSPVLPERLAFAAEFIAGLGYLPEIFPSCRSRLGFLAGADELRARDINRAFADPEIRAVVVVRGGYGGARLADWLDYDMIKANPKIFTGFSDATVLHILINQRCGMATFHAPMPAAANFREDEFTHDALADALAGRWNAVYDNSHTDRNAGVPLECVFEGRGEGRLVGGNLTMIASTAGTPYKLDCRDSILFLEDVGEYAYAIDRSVLHMKHSGILEGCRGVILGTWLDCQAPSGMPVSLTLRNALESLGIPVISGIQCGHSVPSTFLPLGMNAEIIVSPWECSITIGQ